MRNYPPVQPSPNLLLSPVGIKLSPNKAVLTHKHVSHSDVLKTKCKRNTVEYNEFIVYNLSFF